MKLKELIEEHTLEINQCGKCECGEEKFDLITDVGLVYPPIHKSTIRKVKPELLKEQTKNEENY